MSGLLHFPFISIPRTEWLLQALLYWDNIASIVPLDFVEHPEWYTPAMAELVESGLVTQVFPEEHIWELPGFESTFLHYLSDDFHTQKTIRDLRARKRRTFLDVHLGKLGELPSELQRMGLGRINGDGPWMKIESGVAQKFMTYLALVLGQRTDLQPATDRPDGLRHVTSSFGGWIHQPASIRLDSERKEVLRQILPVPDEIPDIWELVRFKERYGAELVQFRLRVEQFLLELEAAPEFQRADLKRLFYSEMEEQRRSVEGILGQQRWAPLSFMNLISVASATVSFSDGLAGTSDRAAVAAGLSLLGAVGAAVKSRNDGSQLKNHPVAYAVHVARRWPGRRREMGLYETR